MSQKILAYDVKKEKRVLAGELRGTDFFKRVEPKHFMRRVDGYGISESAFQEIAGLGCKRIIIQTKTDQWKAPFKTWVEHGHVADFGSGKQRFLSMKYMSIRKFHIEFEGNTGYEVEDE